MTRQTLGREEKARAWLFCPESSSHTVLSSRAPTFSRLSPESGPTYTLKNHGWFQPWLV